MRRALPILLSVLIVTAGSYPAPSLRYTPAGWLPWEEIQRLARSCPVSQPMPFLHPPLGVGGNYANHQRTLYTSIPYGGKVVFFPGGSGFMGPDGSLSTKWPWERVGITGTLQIQGRRLDAPAPPLRAHIPYGYGDTSFQSSALIFPTEGCWEVTGRVGEHSLTFIVLVVRLPIPPLITMEYPFPPGWTLVDDDFIFLDPPYHLRNIRKWREEATGREGELFIDLLYPPPFPWPDIPPGAITQTVMIQGEPARCVQSLAGEVVVEGPVLERGWLSRAWPKRGYGYRVGQRGLGWDCPTLARIADSLSLAGVQRED